MRARMIIPAAKPAVCSNDSGHWIKTRWRRSFYLFFLFSSFPFDRLRLADACFLAPAMVIRTIARERICWAEQLLATVFAAFAPASPLRKLAIRLLNPQKGMWESHFIGRGDVLTAAPGGRGFRATNPAGDWRQFGMPVAIERC
jgi:hypothetical protein